MRALMNLQSPISNLQSLFMSNTPDFSHWSCPLPLRDYPNVVIGHGGGGKLGAELVEHLFVPAFKNDALENLGDSSVIALAQGVSRIAMSSVR